MNNEAITSSLIDALTQNTEHYQNEKDKIEKTHTQWTISYFIIAAILIAITILLLKLQPTLLDKNLFLALINSIVYHFLLQFPLCLGLCFFISKKLDPTKAYDSIDKKDFESMEEHFKALKLAEKQSSRRIRWYLISIVAVVMLFIIISPLIFKLFSVDQIVIVVLSISIIWGCMGLAISQIAQQIKLMKASFAYRKRYKSLMNELHENNK